MSSPPADINMSLCRKLPFGTTRDLATIAVFSQTPNLLVVHPSLPVRTVKDPIALARAKPGALNYSYGGSGTRRSQVPAQRNRPVDYGGQGFRSTGG